MLKFITIAVTMIACVAAAPGLASLGHGPIYGGYGLSAPAISYGAPIAKIAAPISYAAPIAKIAAPAYPLGLGHGVIGAPIGLASHGLALDGHGLALGGHGLALGGHGLALGGHGYGLGLGGHGLGHPIW